jgi:hypothetical protein
MKTVLLLGLTALLCVAGWMAISWKRVVVSDSLSLISNQNAYVPVPNLRMSNFHSVDIDLDDNAVWGSVPPYNGMLKRNGKNVSFSCSALLSNSKEITAQRVGMAGNNTIMCYFDESDWADERVIRIILRSNIEVSIRKISCDVGNRW